MSTIRVVNLQHTDATEPNIVLESDGTATFISGITISGGTNLTVSGVAEFASGTVSAPTITFIDDNNTGIYEPAADTVAITTAGTERLRVNSSGHVGIGTTSPGTVLHVHDGSLRVTASGTEGGQLEFSDKDGATINSLIDVDGSDTFRFITTGANKNIAIGQVANSGGEISFYTSSTERIHVDTTGKIGIGLNSPVELVHLSSSSPRVVLTDTDTGADHRINADSSVGNLAFDIDYNSDTSTPALVVNIKGSEIARFQNDGSVGFGLSNANIHGNFVAKGGYADTANASIVAMTADDAQGRKADVSFYSTFEGTADNGARRTADIIAGFNGSAWGSEYLTFNVGNNGASNDARNITAERARIDGSGRLLVNQTVSAPSASNIGAVLQVNEGAGVAMSINRNSGADAFAANICFRKSRSGTADGTALVAANDALGQIQFMGTDGDQAHTGAQIQAAVDGTPSNDVMPGRLMFFTNSGGTTTTERMRIDSSGRLLIGTSIARTNFFNTTWTPQIQSENVGDQASSMSLVASGNNGQQGILILGNTRGNTGGNTVVNNSDGIGIVSFQGNDGSEMVEGARIQAIVDGTPGANDMPTRLVFETTADGGSSPTPRMLIDSSGRVGIGVTSLTGQFEVHTPANAIEPVRINDTNNTNAVTHRISFRTGGTEVGSVKSNRTSTSFNTSSDYRLKENVIDITDGITRVKQLAPKRFNFIVDAETTVDGFLAHEAQAVVPEAVTGEKDGEDMQGIDQSKLVPLLTAALQEAIAKIETLEQRLNDADL